MVVMGLGLGRWHIAAVAAVVVVNRPKGMADVVPTVWPHAPAPCRPLQADRITDSTPTTNASVCGLAANGHLARGAQVVFLKVWRRKLLLYLGCHRFQVESVELYNDYATGEFRGWPIRAPVFELWSLQNTCGPQPAFHFS